MIHEQTNVYDVVCCGIVCATIIAVAGILAWGIRKSGGGPGKWFV